MVRCGKRFTRLQLRPPVAAAVTVSVVDDERVQRSRLAEHWLVSGYPYVRFSPLDELALWLALGIGYGEMELDVGYGLKVGDRGLLTPFGELGLAREATQMLGLCMGGADSAATAAPQDAGNPKYHFGLAASIRA